MKKICLHFSITEHSRIKSKAALDGLSLMEVGKRLFLDWERGEVEVFNLTELRDLRSGMDMLTSEGYGDQSINDLIDKLDRMIDDENTRGE